MVMGFGYYVAETALARPLPAPRWAWIAFALGVAGTLMAVVTILTGRAAVLFTFYPPLIASVSTTSAWCWSWRRRGSGACSCSSRWASGAGQSRPAGAARHVRDRRQRSHVAVDDRRVAAGFSSR